jgi:cytochrome P450
MSCPVDSAAAATATVDPAAMASADAAVCPHSRVAKSHEHKVFRASQRLFWVFNMYARLRRKDVVKVPFLGYAINGAVAVREMLLDGVAFPNTNSKPETVLISQVAGPNSLTNQNGPPHIELRRKLQDLFTPRYVDELCDRVLGELLDDFRAKLLAGEMVDVARFTKIITGSVVVHLNGEDLRGEALEQRAIELSELGRKVAQMVPKRLRAVSPELLEVANERIERLIAGARETYEAGDETTIPGRFKARGVPWDVARGILVVLILGGMETTQSGGARIVAMLCDTNQWGVLRADHSLMSDAIDEGIRVTTPVPIITRWVAEDCTFRGHRMKKDKLVVAFLNNAVRDRKVIKDGGDFDIRRKLPRELRQLHFGAGPHFCIGNNLARREIELVLEQILALPREVEVLDRSYATHVLIPTYQSVMIRMKPADEVAPAADAAA